MSMGEYSARFEELIRYCPYAELELDGRSKCVKFEMRLRPELIVTFGYEEIFDFPTLVNKCRMYEDNVWMRDAAARKENLPRHYGPQRNFSHGKGKGKVFHEEWKPYSPPTSSWGHISHGPKTHTNAGGSQLNSPSLCGKCGRTHIGDLCSGTTLNCFNSKEVGHVRRVSSPRLGIKPHKPSFDIVVRFALENLVKLVEHELFFVMGTLRLEETAENTTEL
ncbi:hypothetical protein Lal_00036395 [Lupinus albus]|nr:hypothetical protein Lal_00036395 [Lupinus albus]